MSDLESSAVRLGVSCHRTIPTTAPVLRCWVFRRPIHLDWTKVIFKEACSFKVFCGREMFETLVR